MGVGMIAEDDFRGYVAARGPALCRTAYLLTGDWHAGEDLVQEALARVYLRRHRLMDPASLDPYTRKVLISLFLTSRRRRWHNELAVGELPERAASSAADQLDDRQDLSAALGTIAPRQRAVLVLRYYADLPEVEIADALGCTPGAVKTHAARGLARLRKNASVLEGRTQ
jgi:RNA polymerase sigma-70 factor (sigma-E family)